MYGITIPKCHHHSTKDQSGDQDILKQKSVGGKIFTNIFHACPYIQSIYPSISLLATVNPNEEEMKKKQDKQYLYETICMTANTVVNQKVFHFFKDKQYVCCLVSIPCPIITVFIL